MYALVQNLRFAFRQLRKAPGFTVTVVPLNKGRRMGASDSEGLRVVWSYG
jgi:hypothetical protein